MHHFNKQAGHLLIYNSAILNSLNGVNNSHRGFNFCVHEWEIRRSIIVCQCTSLGKSNRLNQDGHHACCCYRRNNNHQATRKRSFVPADGRFHSIYRQPLRPVCPDEFKTNWSFLTPHLAKPGQTRKPGAKQQQEMPQCHVGMKLLGCPQYCDTSRQHQ